MASIGVGLPGPKPGQPGTAASSGGTGGGPSTERVLAKVRSESVAATDAFHGAVWATVPAPGPALPAEVGDEDAGAERLEERPAHRVGPRAVRPGDRVVEDVHAVGDRLVDAGQDGGDRAVVDAHAVGDQVRPRRHALHGPRDVSGP